MTDRPILFSAPMIRALLDGRKTQTRRVLKPQPPEWCIDDKNPGFSCVTPPGHIEFRGHHPQEGYGGKFIKLPYSPGDRIWVREKWLLGHPVWLDPSIDAKVPVYAADYVLGAAGSWKPSIFMPRWASRLTLVVTDVRVERVQDISEDDARTEGCPDGEEGPTIQDRPGVETIYEDAREWFAQLWDDLNAKRGYGWDDNPWVVALTFEVHHCNIDQMEQSA